MSPVAFAGLPTSRWSAVYTRDLTHEIRPNTIQFQGATGTYEVHDISDPDPNQILTIGTFTNVTYTQSGQSFIIRGQWHEFDEDGEFTFIVSPSAGSFDGNWRQIPQPGETGSWRGNVS